MRKRTKDRIAQLDLEARQQAAEGSNKKKFHVQDLRQVQPKTKAQRDVFMGWNTGNHMLMTGSAGTGKTFLAVFLALREVLDPSTPYRRLIIVRSAVPSREQGFLPGTKEEKEEVYELPYKAICNELFPYAKSYDNLKKGGYIEFETTSYIRGLTMDRAVVVVDECANMTFEELELVLTRMGDDSRLIFSGDYVQTDLNKRKNDVCGLADFERILSTLSEFSIIKFKPQDIVRSGLVRSYLLAKEKLGL